VDKPEPTFVMAEIERLLEQVEQEREEPRTWFTTKELARQAEVSPPVMRRKILKLVQAGTVRCIGRRPCRSEMTGEMHPTYAYEIVREETEQ
jgi:DNA-binding GntR family transcriptional regulator